VQVVHHVLRRVFRRPEGVVDEQDPRLLGRDHHVLYRRGGKGAETVAVTEVARRIHQLLAAEPGENLAGIGRINDLDLADGRRDL
jgi:hypothetical protein